MTRKPLYLILFPVLLLIFITACFSTPQVSQIVAITTFPPQKSEVVATSTIQPTKTAVVPTPTEEEASVTETEVFDICANTTNPCECLGRMYEYDKELGDIKEEYIGSWHASAFVGSAYNERFVFFPTGNYLFFPSQYECDYGDESCVPSPIEEGVWGIQDSQINLAKEGDTKNVRRILIGEVIDSPAEESPYPLKTTFDGTTYWLLSKDTNMWNPDTGELCDGY